MPQIYLGTNAVDGVYLGTQNVCDAFVGPVKAFDNCAYTPTTVFLNESQISVSGTNTTEGTSYLISTDPSYSQSGQPGGPVTFQTSVTSIGSYTILSTTLPTTTTGTFPSSGSTTVYAQGSIVIGGGSAPPNTRNNYTLSVGSLPNAGYGISDAFSEGPEGSADSTPLVVTFTEDPNYENYNLSLSGPGILTKSGNQWTSSSFTPGVNYPAASLSPATNNYGITGTPTLITFSRTFNFRDGANNSNTTVSWNISGSNIISDTNGTSGTLITGGDTSTTITFTGSVTGSISVSPASYYTLGTVVYGSEGSSATETTSGPTNPPSPILEVVTAPTTPVVYSSSWFDDAGPFSTELAACTAANQASSPNSTVYYQGSISNGLLYVNSNLTGQLSGGYYFDWNAFEVGYYTFNSGWSSIGGC